MLDAREVEEMIIVRPDRDTYSVKDQLKAAGAVFGQRSDGIDSKWWAFECDTVEAAKQKILFLKELGFESVSVFFPHGKHGIKDRSNLTEEEKAAHKELYFFKKDQDMI
jgi:hypothetical protein